MERFDLLVVGGGINGAAVARDAAIRGAKVLLVEKDDLAGHTSSASSKLIHGGLRYLEYREFRLVRESLRERETLLRTAPHIVRPLQFVLPDGAGTRPYWEIRLGLWLYDLMALGGSLGRSRRLREGTGFDAPLAGERRLLHGDLQQCPFGRVHRGVTQFVIVHLSESLEALKVVLVCGVVEEKLGLLRVVAEVDLLLADQG